LPPRSLNRRDHSEDRDIGGRKIILEWILRKFGGEVWIVFIWLKTGTLAGCCEHGNETSGSLKGGEFLD
jgi:hypothetical protein